MMRRTAIPTLMLAAVVSTLGTSAAFAASPHPWSDVAAGDFVAPAGSRCPFTLSGTVLSDKERIRTVETYADGSPRTQQVVGQLVVRYTNVESGASVDRNLTGNGVLTLRPDGSLRTLMLQGGHFAAGLGVRDDGGPAFLVFTGAGHAVTFEPDGTRTVVYGSGPVENICATLS